MPQLVDAKGRPIKSRPRSTPVLERLAKLGVKDNGSGEWVISKEAMAKIQQDRLRDLAVTHVPSTPRHLVRDIGGMAVAKGIGRWPHMTMEMLREIRERCGLLQVIHNARQYQIRRMCQRWSGKRGEVGWRVIHKDHNQHDSKPPEGFEPFINRFERVLERPSPRHRITTLGTFLAPLWEDLATINRPTVEVIHSLVDKKRVVQFRPVDGGLIWETLLLAEKWKQDDPRWHGGRDERRITPDDEIDILSARMDLDLRGVEYVLVQEGQVLNTYRSDQLIVAPIINRTDVRWAGYPPSNVEQAIHHIAAFIAAFDYNATYFTKGMMAEFLLGLPGDLSDQDVDAFIDMFREATQGLRNAWQPPIIPLVGDAEIQKIDLKASNKEMMFEIWLSFLVSQICGEYRMDTSVIGAKPWDGGQGGHLSEPSREQEIALAKEEGLQGDLGHLVENILNPLARRCHPDLRVQFMFGDFDPEKEAKVYDIRSNVDMTRNEVRMEQGLHPMGYWVEPEKLEGLDEEKRKKYDENPWNWPKDAVFAGVMNQRAQLENQSEMMEQYGDQGQQPGEQQQPGPYGEQDDDGFGGQTGQPDAAPFGQAPPGAGAPPQQLGKASSETIHVYVEEHPS